MLGDLSSNLVLDVLRSAPGSLSEHVAQLPQSLAFLVGLAHIPSLAAMCFPATESTDQGSSADLLPLTLCVDTSQAQRGLEGEDDMSACSEVDIAEACLWPQVANVTHENISSGLFTLERRPGVVVCRLLARISALQNMTVCLPDSTCLLFGSCTDNVKLQGVTFQGAEQCCCAMSAGCQPPAGPSPRVHSEHAVHSVLLMF